VLDKLEVRVRSSAQFRPQFASLFADLVADPKGPFRSKEHYERTADLRMYGHEVILHLACRHGEPNNKVEFVDSGKHTFDFLLNEVEQIFDVNPMSCGVMRVDCAADMPGVGVLWFHQHARVRWKQFANEIGVLTLEPANASSSLYSQMGKREVQTLNFGKRPNCYRIYDKPAEWRAEYRRIRQHGTSALIKRMKKAGASAEQISWRLRIEGINPDADICDPSFEEIYGVPEHGYTLTRCERQIGGGQVPTIPTIGKPAREWERLDSVRALKNRLLEFNPYRDIEIVGPGLAEPARENYRLEDYMAGMYLQSRIQREGLQQTRSWLNSHLRTGTKAPGRHASRLLEKFSDFLSPVDGSTKVLSSSDELYERYRQSLSKQFAG
jgi:hypothetical protein